MDLSALSLVVLALLLAALPAAILFTVAWARGLSLHYTWWALLGWVGLPIGLGVMWARDSDEALAERMSVRQGASVEPADVQPARRRSYSPPPQSRPAAAPKTGTFLRAFGLAFLVLVTVAGLVGTAVFGALYFTKDEGLTKTEADATATAAYDRGKAANTCDTIVGGTANSLAGAKPGDKVSSRLKIRSTKTGQVYEIDGPVNCIVTATGCTPATDYGIGDPWPPRCGK